MGFYNFDNKFKNIILLFLFELLDVEFDFGLCLDLEKSVFVLLFNLTSSSFFVN